MLKRVLALPGQAVCRSGLSVSVDAIEMGEARDRDGRCRPLPKWQGRRVVGDGELFVMNWRSASSLDGRYFGSASAPSLAVRSLCGPGRTDRARIGNQICHSSVRPECGTILPSRPIIAQSSRVAAVQGGRKAGAKRRYPGRARARRHACTRSGRAFASSCRCSLC